MRSRLQTTVRIERKTRKQQHVVYRWLAGLDVAIGPGLLERPQSALNRRFAVRAYKKKQRMRTTEFELRVNRIGNER